MSRRSAPIATGLAIAVTALLSATARAEQITAKFMKNGRQTITVGPGQPGTLVATNPSQHAFKCTHYTEGLRIVATPAVDMDVTLRVERDGRKPGKPIDRGVGGKAERYDGHPPLGKTTFRIEAKSGSGEVVVTWTWDGRCCEKCKTDVPGGRRWADSLGSRRRR